MENKKGETLKLARKKVDEFSQRLERYDRFRRSRRSLEGATNWILAISAGTLLWLLGNFDKFIVSIVVPNKSLFLFSALFLCISTIIFALIRGILYLRQIGMDKALEDIEGLPDRVYLNKESKTEEELEEMVKRIGTRSIELWGKGHNLITHVPSLFKVGWIFYISGLVISVIYILSYVLK